MTGVTDGRPVYKSAPDETARKRKCVARVAGRHGSKGVARQNDGRETKRLNEGRRDKQKGEMFRGCASCRTRFHPSSHTHTHGDQHYHQCRPPTQTCRTLCIAANRVLAWVTISTTAFRCSMFAFSQVLLGALPSALSSSLACS